MKKTFMVIGIILVVLFVSIFLAKGVLSNNYNNNNNNNSAPNTENKLSEILLRVSIPCEGHVPLITGEVGKLVGVEKVEYLGTFNFKVYYDEAKTSKEAILGLEVFKEYKAKEVGK
jgi:hypothetical protein